MSPTHEPPILDNPVLPDSSLASLKDRQARRQEVTGLLLDPLTLPDAVNQIESFIVERKPRQVILANAFTVAFCRRNDSLTALVNGSDLVLADGMSIVWGSRWIGASIPARVAGPDLMDALCARAESKGYCIFLMGSSDENLNCLKQVMRLRWPKLHIAGVYSPSVCDRFGEDENRLLLHEINKSKADILFVGLSAPKQEIWIAENLHRLDIPVAIGVGAAFDFLSGRIPRAPRMLRNIGFEWFYRLWCEPRRLWKRYLLGNAVFLSLLFNRLLNRKLISQNRTPS